MLVIFTWFSCFILFYTMYIYKSASRLESFSPFKKHDIWHIFASKINMFLPLFFLNCVIIVCTQPSGMKNNLFFEFLNFLSWFFFLVSLTLCRQFQANFEFLVTILTKTFRFRVASYCCCRLAVSACNTSGTTHRPDGEPLQRREQSKMSDGESFWTGCRAAWVLTWNWKKI